jgi:RNA polymerase sigma factor (sigma-70 family)
MSTAIYKESSNSRYPLPFTAPRIKRVVQLRVTRSRSRHVDAEISPSFSTNEISTVVKKNEAKSRQELIHEMVVIHQPKIYRFVLKRIGHHDDANDIAQHTIAEAARTIDEFRGESQLSTWIFGIAMNAIRNYLNRSPHKLHKFESDEILLNIESQEIDPCTRLEHKRLMQSVSHAIADLPEEMSRVLLMVTVDQISYEEAASMLEIPIGTVRSRISRARSMLKERLEKNSISLPF